GGVPSPLGASSAAAANLVIGSPLGRGALQYTGPSVMTDGGFTLVSSPFGITYVVVISGLTVNGQVTGDGRLTNAGSGTLVLGHAANNYSGGTTVTFGTLRVNDVTTNGGGALGSGVITLSGGTLSYGGAMATSG